MRLTADLINASLSYLNPLKERELDLRGVFQRDGEGIDATRSLFTNVDPPQTGGFLQAIRSPPSKTWVSQR